MGLLTNSSRVCCALIALLLAWSEMGMALNATVPQCKMDATGRVVVVWLAIDNTGKPIIQSIIRSSGGDWSDIVTISHDISDQIVNNQPRMYSNGNGDVVVLWQYADTSTNKHYVAASMLPAGTSTWNTATLSTSDENASFGDQCLSINDNGNLLAMWSSYNITTQEIRVSTSTIGANSAWSAPITISN